MDMDAHIESAARAVGWEILGEEAFWAEDEKEISFIRVLKDRLGINEATDKIQYFSDRMSDGAVPSQETIRKAVTAS